jgi:DNA primase
MTEDKLRALLARCGIDSLTDRGNNITGLCPAHEETDASWGISKTEPHLHGCFSCGFKGNLTTLVIKCLKVSAVKAAQIAEQNLALPRARDIVLSGDDIENYKRESRLDRAEELWREFVPAAEGYRYLLKRGVRLSTAREIGARFDFEQKRVLFPWYKNGVLQGFTGRLTVGDVDPKYKTIPYAELPKGELLYIPRLFRPKENRIVIVEGEIDAILTTQDTGELTGALGFGTFTDEQLEYIGNLGVSEILIFTDDDKAGINMSVGELTIVRFTPTTRRAKN